MKPLIKYVLVLLGLVLIGLGLVNWYFSKPKVVEVSPEEIIQPQKTPPPQINQNKPVAHYPIDQAAPDATPAEALPSLQVSDTAMRKALSNLFN